MIRAAALLLHAALYAGWMAAASQVDRCFSACEEDPIGSRGNWAYPVVFFLAGLSVFFTCDQHPRFIFVAASWAAVAYPLLLVVAD
jgi:hypothetical protein